MRKLILIWLLKLASSAPQDYSYPGNQRQPHTSYGPIETPTSFEILNSLNAFAGHSDFNEQFISNQTPLKQANPLTSANTLHISHQHPIVSKRFFVHSAPEEDDDDEVLEKHITVGKVHKNFNVVFIKAPLKSAQRATIKITPALNEEKTFIYVLNKKPNVGDIDAHVEEPVTTTSKPEVIFIKYRTNEEAEHAQRVIQSQYDVLGGSSQISDEGIAPLIESVENAKITLNEEADAEEYVNSEDYQSHQAESDSLGSISNEYLPTSIGK